MNIVFIFSRHHKESLKRFRNTLDDASKERRHRRLKINIHITFLAWLAEFTGFLFLFIGKFLVGHENNVVNFSMQTLTFVIYFNIVPCIFLINDTDFKGKVAESSCYNAILNVFKCQYIHEDDNNDEKSIDDSKH